MSNSASGLVSSVAAAAPVGAAGAGGAAPAACSGPAQLHQQPQRQPSPTMKPRVVNGSALGAPRIARLRQQQRSAARRQARLNMMVQPEGIRGSSSSSAGSRRASINAWVAHKNNNSSSNSAGGSAGVRRRRRFVRPGVQQRNGVIEQLRARIWEADPTLEDRGDGYANDLRQHRSMSLARSGSTASINSHGGGDQNTNNNNNNNNNTTTTTGGSSGEPRTVNNAAPASSRSRTPQLRAQQQRSSNGGRPGSRGSSATVHSGSSEINDYVSDGDYSELKLPTAFTASAAYAPRRQVNPLRRRPSGHYIKHKLLGRGSYGETWLVEYLPQQQAVVSSVALNAVQKQHMMQRMIYRSSSIGRMGGRFAAAAAAAAGVGNNNNGGASGVTAAGSGAVAVSAAAHNNNAGGSARSSNNNNISSCNTQYHNSNNNNNLRTTSDTRSMSNATVSTAGPQGGTSSVLGRDDVFENSLLAVSSPPTSPYGNSASATGSVTTAGVGSSSAAMATTDDNTATSTTAARGSPHTTTTTTTTATTTPHNCNNNANNNNASASSVNNTVVVVAPANAPASVPDRDILLADQRLFPPQSLGVYAPNDAVSQVASAALASVTPQPLEASMRIVGARAGAPLQGGMLSMIQNSNAVGAGNPIVQTIAATQRAHHHQKRIAAAVAAAAASSASGTATAPTSAPAAALPVGAAVAGIGPGGRVSASLAANSRNDSGGSIKNDSGGSGDGQVACMRHHHHNHNQQQHIGNNNNNSNINAAAVRFGHDESNDSLALSATVGAGGIVIGGAGGATVGAAAAAAAGDNNRPLWPDNLLAMNMAPGLDAFHQQDIRWQAMPGPGDVSALASTRRTIRLSSGTEIPADRVYVCKTILRDPSRGSMRATIDEINVLATCAHPCILAFIESFVQEDRLHVITEYMDFGDLEVELRKRRTHMRHFSESTVLFLFCQLCLALEYLHRHNILHRDIKTANVLLSRLWLVKLCDFGFAKQCDMDVDMNVSTSRLGTPYYMAPELWQNQPYSAKADMWSLGVLFYELLTLVTPFACRSYPELQKLVTTGEYAPITREGVSDEAIEIVKALLVVDPDKRMTAKQVLQMPILTDTLNQFMRKFERAAAASSAPIDAHWCEVLKAHAALVQEDPGESSTKSRQSKRQRENEKSRELFASLALSSVNSNVATPLSSNSNVLSGQLHRPFFDSSHARGSPTLKAAAATPTGSRSSFVRIAGYSSEDCSMKSSNQQDSGGEHDNDDEDNIELSAPQLTRRPNEAGGSSSPVFAHRRTIKKANSD